MSRLRDQVPNPEAVPDIEVPEGWELIGWADVERYGYDAAVKKIDDYKRWERAYNHCASCVDPDCSGPDALKEITE